MWSKFGLIGGVALGGVDMWTNQLLEPVRHHEHGKTDAESTGKAQTSNRSSIPNPMACCPSTG
jgi:electron-transferring-flavoprotein dehydrogenase